MKISSLVGSIGMFVDDKKSEIFLGIGIGGLIGTAVLSGIAAIKASKKIEQVKKEENRDKLEVLDVIKHTWPLFIPPVITGTLSIASIFSSYSEINKRSAALATAYSVSEHAFREYKEKVVEELGEKKEEKIRDRIAKDKIDGNPPVEQEIILTEKGNTLCYDVFSGRYFKSDIDIIRKAENLINRQMLSDNYASLNDFYNAIDLPGIKIGDSIGWNVWGTNGMALSFSSHLTDHETPCLVIDYGVYPERGFDER